MADNFAPDHEQRHDEFDPNPDPATIASNLVRHGFFISSTALLAMLSPLPHAVMTSSLRIKYAFFIALILMFLFGFGMIGIGFLISDYPTRYTVLGRIVTRLSYLALVFAVAVHDATNK